MSERVASCPSVTPAPMIQLGPLRSIWPSSSMQLRSIRLWGAPMPWRRLGIRSVPPAMILACGSAASRATAAAAERGDCTTKGDIESILDLRLLQGGALAGGEFLRAPTLHQRIEHQFGRGR